jgi:hypothetical protein
MYFSIFRQVCDGYYLIIRKILIIEKDCSDEKAFMLFKDVHELKSVNHKKICDQG